jgi:hypothetical protein
LLSFSPFDGSRFVLLCFVLFCFVLCPFFHLDQMIVSKIFRTVSLPIRTFVTRYWNPIWGHSSRNPGISLVSDCSVHLLNLERVLINCCFSVLKFLHCRDVNQWLYIVFSWFSIIGNCETAVHRSHTHLVEVIPAACS